jgi:hypothetical protein
MSESSVLKNRAKRISQKSKITDLVQVLKQNNSGIVKSFVDQFLFDQGI